MTCNDPDALSRAAAMDLGVKLLPARTRAFVDFIVAHFKRPHIAARFDATR